MLHSVALNREELQHHVAHTVPYAATLGGMEPWKTWRKRAKEWKKDNKISDTQIAAALGRERSTANSWLNKRDPNLSDFMALCEAMGADPGLILFGQAVLPGAVKSGSDAHKAMTSSPTATPGHDRFVQQLKVRTFKQKKARLRRIIVEV